MTQLRPRRYGFAAEHLKDESKCPFYLHLRSFMATALSSRPIINCSRAVCISQNISIAWYFVSRSRDFRVVFPHVFLLDLVCARPRHYSVQRRPDGIPIRHL